MTPPVRVFVYKHLPLSLKTGSPVYSIKALEGEARGRVIHRSGHVHLANVKGKVSEAGRQRVLREGRKNVHAGMVGDLISLRPDEYFIGHEVTYNPRKYESFVYRDTEAPFDEATQVYLSDRGVFAIPRQTGGMTCT